MKIAVLANTNCKEELLMQGMKEGTELLWANDPGELIAHRHADAYIDLLFEHKKERIDHLKKINTGLVIVNSVITTGSELPENFIRINGWPTFLKRSIIEAALPDSSKVSDTYLKTKAENIISCFNKKPEWTPDIPGFLTCRTIAMIINEAYFALDEKVSTREEIDLAMKLGTNYPYGPFEWSEKIGLKNIHDLLSELSKTNARYQPAALLIKEASA